MCGRTTLSPEALAEAGFAAVHELRASPDTNTSMREAPRLLHEVGHRLRSQWHPYAHPLLPHHRHAHRKDHRHERPAQRGSASPRTTTPRPGFLRAAAEDAVAADHARNDEQATVDVRARWRRAASSQT